MAAHRIIENLWLGSMHEVPADADYIVTLSAELYEQAVDTAKFPVWYETDNHLYYNAEDYPEHGVHTNIEIGKMIVSKIDEHVKKGDKVYVHCLYGINRSASHVFMYLVASGQLLKSTNVEDAMFEFKRFYSRFSPNPGWAQYIRENFPFKNWIKK